MDFEKGLERSLFSQSQDKTYIDKVLSRQDIEKIEEIIQKEKLGRKDLLRLLYLLSSAEVKLANLGDYERYILLKFFVWIREFVKVCELFYDYQDDLKKKKGEDKLPERATHLLRNNERYLEHNVKFLIDLYFNILRTTLSIGGTGVLEILRNKYEIAYSGMPSAAPPPPEKSHIFGGTRK